MVHFYLLLFKRIAQCLGIHSCIFTGSSLYNKTSEHSPRNKVLINNLSSMLISPAGRHFFCNDFLIQRRQTQHIDPWVGKAFSSGSLISVCEVLRRQALREKTIISSSSSIFHLTCSFSSLEITEQHPCS